jgi:UDP-N-acetylmuramate--alanine ligase
MTQQEHYHFIGIGGIGMSGLAHMLLKQGVPVSGSDIATSYVTEGLVQAGAKVYQGHLESHVKAGMTIVFTSDIKLDNPEYVAAKNLGCTLWHRSDLLARLMRDQIPLAVAGTHGKTTTSALLSCVLIEAGLDPSIVVGGTLPQYKCNSRFGLGKHFAFEADESDVTFLKYHPFGAIVTNIDSDHLINYNNSELILIGAFKQFMSQVSSPQHLFWCGDDEKLLILKTPGQSYGVSSSCNWRLSNVHQKGFTTFFDIEAYGKNYKDVELGLIGNHNALNATAVFGLAITLGLPEEAIRHAFKIFKGVLRRCEIKGEEDGILFIDDYAHHPTEILTTLKGIRQAIQTKRLVTVFQPHRYSRTKDCLGTYGTIFDSADHVIVTDIYSGGEKVIDGLHAGLILDEIKNSSSIPCEYIERSKLADHLNSMAESNDVIVTLGAGDITRVSNETMALAREKNKALIF